MKYPHKLLFIFCLAVLLTVTLPFYIELYWWYAPLIFLIYLIFKGIGAEVGSHRYWTHKSFEASQFWQKIMSVLHLFNGDGTMIVFVGIHRLHHQYSDTPDDPHSPHHNLWGTLFYQHNVSKWNRTVVKDVASDSWLQHLHRYYFHYHALIITVFALTSLTLLWFYAVNILCSWFINNLINVGCHLYGIIDHPHPTDKSKNNWWAEIILLGVGTHNNHHYDPSRISNAWGRGRFDIWGWIISKIQIKNIN